MLSIHVIDQLGYVISCYCMLCELSAYCCIDSLIVALYLLLFVVFCCLYVLQLQMIYFDKSLLVESCALLLM